MRREKLKDFTEITAQHMSSLKIEDRKKLGQYMTPQRISSEMAKLFSFTKTKEYKILDPAVGTGELLLAVQKQAKSEKATIETEGWDIDFEILQICEKNSPETVTRQQSIYNPIPSHLLNHYDKIIANPPYFQVPKNSKNLQNLHMETLSGSGRVNIYALFFEYSLRLLKTGGELVFLVPPSMNNGAYFAKTREHILSKGYIKNLTILRDNNSFDKATTSTQIIHIIKTGNTPAENIKLSENYLFNFNEVNKTANLPTIFTEDSRKLRKIWQNRESLHDRGYTVKTGTIEWNRKKDLFQKEGLPLIYSKDISSENTLKFSAKLKDRRFLPRTVAAPIDKPSIIANRIVGSLTNPKLKFCLIPLPGYYAENHVNVITSANPDSHLEELAEKLNKANLYLPEYIKLITGNTQISSRELEYMIPI